MSRARPTTTIAAVTTMCHRRDASVSPGAGSVVVLFGFILPGVRCLQLAGTGTDAHLVVKQFRVDGGNVLHELRDVETLSHKRVGNRKPNCFRRVALFVDVRHVDPGKNPVVALAGERQPPTVRRPTVPRVGRVFRVGLKPQRWGTADAGYRTCPDEQTNNTIDG